MQCSNSGANVHEIEISVVNPEELMSKVNNLNLRTFATEIKDALQQVLNRC